VHARTTTLDARPGNIDAGLAYIRDEVFGALTNMPGCVGMSVVADRDGGRCIATSAWESEDAMRATEASVGPLREKAAEIFGSTPNVEEWEIAVVHRDHASGDGACVRSTWIQGDPADVDRSIDVFKLTTMPALEEYDGFCSASLLVNRATGRALVTIALDSRDALDRSRERANAVRERTVTEMQAAVQEVREFDLVMAHLHVPEMA
jgi:heme-degrading monooxygenase HmoA